jgi:uncharacterized protein YecE (DUF72 family)
VSRARASARGNLRIGCSGWNYKHWRNGVFYPPRLAARRWLEFYAQHFDTVEINATFYRLPTEEAVARWVAETPPEFCFAVKMSRYVTHVKRLTDTPKYTATFYERIEPMLRSPKLGATLWQFAPNFQRTEVNVERLGETLAQHRPGRHAFEFRHASWFVDETYDELRSAGAALVIGDDPRRPFQTREVTSDFAFVRFHGGGELESGDYTEAELESWAQWIEQVRSRGIDVFAYFNNDWEGFAIENGLRLKELLGV